MFLLRRRALGLAPRLALDLHGRRVRVEVEPRDAEAEGEGYAQLVGLWVWAVDERGRVWSFAPDGSLADLPDLPDGRGEAAGTVAARTNLRLVPSTTRPTRLCEFVVPRTHGGARIVEVRARLYNTGVSHGDRLAIASGEAVARID